MAHIIDILSSSTINLTSAPYLLLEYKPVTPPMTAEQIMAALRDGGELPLVLRRNIVNEPCKVLLKGTDADDLKLKINTIETALLLAEAWQRDRSGVETFVSFQPDGRSVAGRSEILSGYVDYDQDLLDSQWRTRKIVLTIYWTRRFFWELPEVELALSNSSGSNVTGGIVVYNQQDTDPYTNLISFTPASGVLPAPLRIEITNTKNDSNRNYTYQIAHGIWSDLSTVGHILQSDQATGGTTVVSAAASGGSYKTFTWAGDTSQEVATWTLSTARLNAMAGRYYRMLARFISPTAGTWLKWKVKLEGSVIYESEEVLSTTEAIQDLDTLPLAPYLVGAGDLYPLTLVLCARKVGGGSFSLDFVQTSPLDGYRRLHPRVYGHQYGARLVDDGIAELVYKDGAVVTGKSGHYRGEGSIMAWPAQLQQLYFLWTTTSGLAEIDRTLSVKVYHRPRILSF